MRLAHVRELGRAGLSVYRCTCGNEKVLARRDVRSGRVKSCGCLNDELRATRNHRHGDATRAATSPEYRIWRAIIGRCCDPKNKDFELYGARRISICAEWRHDFARFLCDVGRRPAPHLTLDRIDNDGNYEPGNMRWTTQSQQARNRRPKRWYRRPPNVT